MNRLWDPILRDLTEAAQPRCLVEIGVDTGLLTAKLLDYCASADAVLHAIDPRPELDVNEWRAHHGERLLFHRARSLDVLEQIHMVDMVFIDGDHNWFTVYHELRQLERTSLRDGQPPPLIALHDVGWPYGRRDMYYDPESIRESDRQPYRTLGLVPGESEPVEGGLNADFHNAISESSPRNGVRTAVEDFVAESELEWRTLYLPGLHGLGIAFTGDRVSSNERLRGVIDSVCSVEFWEQWVEELELERIRVELALHRTLAHAKVYEHQARDLNRELEDLRVTFSQAEREFARSLATASADLDLVRTQYERVVNSKSWRLTQPLRRAARIIRSGR